MALADEARADCVSLTIKFGARREGELDCEGEGHDHNVVSIGCKG